MRYRPSAMMPIVSLNVLAASAGLSPLLEASQWDGVIAAVFQTSIHISGPHDTLLHLQGGPFLVSPFSLRVDRSLAGVIKDLSLVESMPVHKEGSHLEVPGRLRLLAEEVHYYQSHLVTAEEIDPKALRHAKRVLRLEGRWGGFEAIPCTPAIVAAILKALTDRDPDRLLNASRQIIGLGPGLTPSGDDFLVGCLKGLWLMTKRKPALHSAIHHLRKNLTRDLSDRTTRVGAEFIRHALNGQFAEVLDRASAALLSPTPPEAVSAAISRLIAQGETSGTDTAKGLLTCLDALLHAPHGSPPPDGHRAEETDL